MFKNLSNMNKELYKVYLFEVLSRMHFFSAVLIPFFTDWGGLSLTQIMFLQSFFLFSTFLLEIPTGAVADYIGRRTSMVIGAVVNAIGAIIYISAPEFGVFMLGEFLFALGFTLISGSSEAFVYDTLKTHGHERLSKKIFGRLGSFHLAGIMIGAFVGSFIASNLGITYTMIFMAVPFTLAAFVGLSLKEPYSFKKSTKTYISIIHEGFGFLLKHRVLKILALDLAVVAALSYFMIWFYQLLLMQAGVDIKYFGMVHTVLVAVEIAIMSNYSFFEKIFGSKKNLIFASTFIVGIFYIIAGFTSWLPLILAVIFFAGGFGLSRPPLLINYMNKYIPSHKRATVLSAVSMFKMLLIAILAPFAGMLADWSLNYTFIILGVLAIGFSIFSRVEESHLID